MTKRIFLAVLAALALLVPAAAGDVATFVDLGFSPDSSYFMFGQYGVQTDSGKPWAELYLVDTKKNDFVPKGTLRKVFENRLEPGQDSLGALFALYGDSTTLAKGCKIDNLAAGRLIYVLLDGEEPPASLSFRDFKTGGTYDLALQKSVSETKDGVSSSFGLSVALTGKDGGTKRVTAGNPDIKRSGVKDYVVRRVILAPDERTLVVIIEKRMADKGDQAIRYMVETVKLP